MTNPALDSNIDSKKKAPSNAGTLFHANLVFGYLFSLKYVRIMKQQAQIFLLLSFC